MSLIEDSFKRLFPTRQFNYGVEEKYSLQLSDFNANIKLHNNKITVKYNLQWKNIDDEIKIGLVQTLLLKVFKRKRQVYSNTLNMDLYNDFLKRIPSFIPKNQSDPVLEESFHRVNENLFVLHFTEKLDQPNLKWGTHSIRRLACYNFHNDTITVSKVFQKSSPEVLDLLMYHELLHKKFQFENKKGRNSYHSSEFKRAEEFYPNKSQVEKQIDSEIRSFRYSGQAKKVVAKRYRKKKFNLLDFFR